jgi:arylsulfatase A-like enzyme
MTGLSPKTHTAMKDSLLPDTLITLAEIFRDNGYLTSGIGSNTFLNEEYRMNQGFTEYDWYPRTVKRRGNSIGIRLLYRLNRWESLEDATTSQITDLAVRWLEANSQNDFFLWIHYFDPHIPYRPPAEYISGVVPPHDMGVQFKDLNGILDGQFKPDRIQKEWIRRLYQAEVRYVDHEVGRLIRKIRELNCYEDMLIVFASDHGEEFWEHRGFYHGHALYDEVIRIPLIVKIPGKSMAAGGEIPERVTLQHLMPTLVELCDLDTTEHHAAESWVSLLSGEKRDQPDIFSTSTMLYEEKEGVIFNNYKYIRGLDYGNEELYDLDRDPGEQHPIQEVKPFLLETARRKMQLHRETALQFQTKYRLGSEQKIIVDKEVIERLRSLGYIK